MRRADFPAGTPHLEAILADAPEMIVNGGSCVAGPDGQWLCEPVIEDERLIVTCLDHRQVRMERQNFDPAGHYGRPDVTAIWAVHDPSPEDLKAQANDYARLFSILIKHKDAIRRVTFWGLSDRRTWRYGQHPLIFDANNQRKPAYTAIVEALRPNHGEN